MAGASDKKLAKTNEETLKSIHTLSIVITVLALAVRLVFHRPSAGLFRFFIFSTPAWVTQYMLEQMSRPLYETNADGYRVLVKPGSDLSQEGLTEYMVDLVYLTLVIHLINMLFGTNHGWWLLSFVPLMALYQTRWLWSRFLPSLGAFSKSKRQTEAAAASAAPAKSKRQAKLEKKQKKQQGQMRGFQ